MPNGQVIVSHPLMDIPMTALTTDTARALELLRANVSAGDTFTGADGSRWGWTDIGNASVESGWLLRKWKGHLADLAKANLYDKSNRSVKLGD